MTVYTYVIKTKDDEFVETVRREFCSDADDFIKKNILMPISSVLSMRMMVGNQKTA